MFCCFEQCSMCLVGPTLAAMGSRGMDTRLSWGKGVMSSFLEETMSKVNSDNTSEVMTREDKQWRKWEKVPSPRS